MSDIAELLRQKLNSSPSTENLSPIKAFKNKRRVEKAQSLLRGQIESLTPIENLLGIEGVKEILPYIKFYTYRDKCAFTLKLPNHRTIDYREVGDFNERGCSMFYYTRSIGNYRSFENAFNNACYIENPPFFGFWRKLILLLIGIGVLSWLSHSFFHISTPEIVKNWCYGVKDIFNAVKGK